MRDVRAEDWCDEAELMLVCRAPAELELGNTEVGRGAWGMVPLTPENGGVEEEMQLFSQCEASLVLVR
jgi:hypothetical protein